MENFDFLTPRGNQSNEDDITISGLFSNVSMPLQHSPVSTAAPAGAGAAGGGHGILTPSTPQANFPPPRPPGLSPGIRASVPHVTVPVCTGTKSKLTAINTTNVSTTATIVTLAQTVAGASGGATTSTSSSNVSSLFQSQMAAQQLMQNPGTSASATITTGPFASATHYLPNIYGNPSQLGITSQAGNPYGLPAQNISHNYGTMSTVFGGGSGTLFGGSAIPAPQVQSHVNPPPVQPAPQQNPPGQLVSPFGLFYNDATPTLHTEAHIQAGGDIINWRMHRPSTELELLLTKQQLLQSGLNYPNVHPDVKNRLSIEMTSISSNQWMSAVGGFATMLQDKTDTASKIDQSILRQSLKVLVECPTLGNNNFSGSAIKTLQTGLQRKRLSGDSSDPLDFSGPLQVLKNTIQQFGLNESAAFLISKEVFSGQLGNFLDSCASSGMPYKTFWDGIQGTLSSTRSPAAILNMINRLKAVKPTYLMQTLNSIYQLHRLHCNITHAGDEDTFRSVRASYFELLRSHYPSYHPIIKQEDALNMKLLRRETERLHRMGLNTLQALATYHPIMSLQQVILYCIGTEINKQPTQNFQNFQNFQKRPQNPPGNFDSFGKYRNPVNDVEVEIDMVSSRASSPELDSQDADNELVRIPASSEEQNLLEHYNALQAEISQLESLAVEKKFKSFPLFKKKDTSRDNKPQNERGCFRCGDLSHFIADCPEKPKRPKSARNQMFKPKLKDEVSPADFMPGDFTVQDLNQLGQDPA